VSCERLIQRGVAVENGGNGCPADVA
jgi:hypothetical protein